MATIPVKDAAGTTVTAALVPNTGPGVADSDRLPVVVSDGGGSVTVDGTVAVSSLPAIGGTVAVSSLPAIGGTVAVSNFPATQPISGAVSVSNLPATQPVSGTVAVSNLPATQPVSAAALPLPSGAATAALQTTGNASLGSLDAKAPALVGGRVPVQSSLPAATSVVIVSLTTNATGTIFNAFASQACTSLDLVNLTGTTLEVRRGGSGNTVPVPTGSARLFVGITNANELQLRRLDTSNTQVTVTAEALS